MPIIMKANLSEMANFRLEKKLVDCLMESGFLADAVKEDECHERTGVHSTLFPEHVKFFTRQGIAKSKSICLEFSGIFYLGADGTVKPVEIIFENSCIDINDQKYTIHLMERYDALGNVDERESAMVHPNGLWQHTSAVRKIMDGRVLFEIIQLKVSRPSPALASASCHYAAELLQQLTEVLQYTQGVGDHYFQVTPNESEDIEKYTSVKSLDKTRSIVSYRKLRSIPGDPRRSRGYLWDFDSNVGVVQSIGCLLDDPLNNILTLDDPQGQLIQYIHEVASDIDTMIEVNPEYIHCLKLKTKTVDNEWVINLTMAEGRHSRGSREGLFKINDKFGERIGILYRDDKIVPSVGQIQFYLNQGSGLYVIVENAHLDRTSYTIYLNSCTQEYVFCISNFVISAEEFFPHMLTLAPHLLSAFIEQAPVGIMQMLSMRLMATSSDQLSGRITSLHWPDIFFGNANAELVGVEAAFDHEWLNRFPNDILPTISYEKVDALLGQLQGVFHKKNAQHLLATTVKSLHLGYQWMSANREQLNHSKFRQKKIKQMKVEGVFALIWQTAIEKCRQSQDVELVNLLPAVHDVVLKDHLYWILIRTDLMEKIYLADVVWKKRTIAIIQPWLNALETEYNRCIAAQHEQCLKRRAAYESPEGEMNWITEINARIREHFVACNVEFQAEMEPFVICLQTMESNHRSIWKQDERILRQNLKAVLGCMRGILDEYIQSSRECQGYFDIEHLAVKNQQMHIIRQSAPKREHEFWLAIHLQFQDALTSVLFTMESDARTLLIKQAIEIRKHLAVTFERTCSKIKLSLEKQQAFKSEEQANRLSMMADEQERYQTILSRSNYFSHHPYRKLFTAPLERSSSLVRVSVTHHRPTQLGFFALSLVNNQPINTERELVSSPVLFSHNPYRNRRLDKR